jgi:hypothetical protein
MKSCNDCEFYHDEYGGVCFAQKDAPRVESLTIARTCSDFTYKDAKILLDPISLSKEQVLQIYRYLNGITCPEGQKLLDSICDKLSSAVSTKLAEETEKILLESMDREEKK